MSFPIEWIGASVEDAQQRIRLSLFTDERTGSMRLDLCRWDRATHQKEVGKFVNGEVEWVKFNEGESINGDCGMKFDIFLQPLMLELFAKVLGKSGKPTKNESLLEGELNATKSHMKDLRHLLKLPK